MTFNPARRLSAQATGASDYAPVNYHDATTGEGLVLTQRGDPVRYIPTSRGFHALVDAVDYDYLIQFHWQAYPNGRAARNGLVSRGEKKTRIGMANEIMRPPPGYCVDHINRKPWDNRRSNLRICTLAENARNRTRDGRSRRFRGVSGEDRFAANLMVDGRFRRVCGFETREEAARCYDDMALHYHGEFATLNFPDRATVAAPKEKLYPVFGLRNAQREIRRKLAELILQGVPNPEAAKRVGVHPCTAWELSKKLIADGHLERSR